MERTTVQYLDHLHQYHVCDQNRHQKPIIFRYRGHHSQRLVQFGHVRNGEGRASYEERDRDHVDRRCGLDEGNLASSEHMDDEDLCYAG